MKRLLFSLLVLALLIGCVSQHPKTRRAARTATAPMPLVVPPKPATVQLGWIPSSNPTVTGYRIYWGPAAGTYTNSVSLGNVTNGAVTNLIIGTQYFFAATAFNAVGGETPFSNEVPFTPTNAISVVNLVITVEHAATPLGPWTAYPTTVYVGPASDNMQVFRALIQRTVAP